MGSLRARLSLSLAIFCALAIAVTTGAVATASPPSTSPEVERLRAIEFERLASLVAADVETARSLMADDFQLVPPPGFPLTREEYLGSVKAGAIDYLVFEPVTEISVRLYGQAAAMRYRGHVRVNVAGLGQFDHEVWFTYVYEKRDGQWQAVWEQATGVGGFPPPPSG
jgi:hypothetical protein